MILRLLLPFLLLLNLAPAATSPRERPATWATPVINTTLDNCYRVSAELYRCEQPRTRDIADLKALGIRSILNLRRYHSDSKNLTAAGFVPLLQRMEADDLTTDDLVAALRQFRDAPKPLLVHCWHGSDRTGSVVAAYRIVFQDWTPAAALDELRHGGYGYHERMFPNIITLFQTLDAAALRRRVLE
ncbi:MAG TPA: tyrosine-protein phosphatase [Lacunisphaera sp.]|nr:tyrosine-protein phosphatase [Lacunisphaera sp.]